MTPRGVSTQRIKTKPWIAAPKPVALILCWQTASKPVALILCWIYTLGWTVLKPELKAYLVGSWTDGNNSAGGYVHARHNS